MNIEIISPFAEAIFNVDLTEIIDNQSLIETMNLQRNADQQGIVRSNAGGWQADIVDLTPELQKLSDHLSMAATDIFRDIYGYKNSRDIVVSNMWWNTNNHGDHNMYHTHPGGVFSGVYYIQTNGLPEQGEINFLRDDNYIWECIRTSACNEETAPDFSQFSSNNFNKTGETGHAFLFPAHYNHRVTENLTDDERIVIGMNFRAV